MDIGSSGYSTDWLSPYGLMEDIAFLGWEFSDATTAFSCPAQLQLGHASSGVDCASADSNHSIKRCGRKRLKSESSAGTSCSKACREKLRRDRLNDRFVELVAVMEPGRSSKTDKAAIVSDATRILTQLRSESRNLKETIGVLQSKVEDLKGEKRELCDERKRLREENERLEQQVQVMASIQQTQCFAHLPSSVITAQPQLCSTNKAMPFMGYPGMTMWPMMHQIALEHLFRLP